MKLMDHVCYDITLDHLIEHYVSMNYYMDTVVVIHNPGSYVESLKNIGLYFEEHEAVFDQIMVVQVDSIESAIHLTNLIDPQTGPICSLWHQGYRISDNIEENLRFAN